MLHRVLRTGYWHNRLRYNLFCDLSFTPLLAFVLSACGSDFYVSQPFGSRRQADDDLSTIANIKVNGIEIGARSDVLIEVVDKYVTPLAADRDGFEIFDTDNAVQIEDTGIDFSASGILLSRAYYIFRVEPRDRGSMDDAEFLSAVGFAASEDASLPPPRNPADTDTKIVSMSLNLFGSAHSEVILGGVANDDIIASPHGDEISAGMGIDHVRLPETSNVDTITYTFDVRATDGWIASDGADTIHNFELGKDKFIFHALSDGETPEGFFATQVNDNLILRALQAPDGRIRGLEFSFLASGTGYGGIQAGNVLTINFATPLLFRDFANRIGNWTNYDFATEQIGYIGDLDLLFGGMEASTEVDNFDIVPIVVTNFAPSGGVSILRAGDVLTADVRALVDANGRGVLSYQWIKFDVDAQSIVELTQPSTTENSYMIQFGDSGVSGDFGDPIRVFVSYRDDEGNNESVASPAVFAYPLINITSDATVLVHDHQVLGTVIHQVQSDGSARFALKENFGDVDQFSITPDGVLRFRSIVDFNAPQDLGRNNDYQIIVLGLNMAGNYIGDEQSVTIRVLDNEPVVLSDTSGNMLTDTSRTLNLRIDTMPGDVVGRVNARDPEGATVRFSLRYGNADLDTDIAAPLTIDSNGIIRAGDIHHKPTLDALRSVVLDASAEGTTETTSVALNPIGYNFFDRVDFGPSFFIDRISIVAAENQPDGIPIYDFSGKAFDKDGRTPTDQLVYSIVPFPNITDDDLFVLDGTVLKFKAPPLDIGSENIYDIAVNVTDKDGFSAMFTEVRGILEYRKILLDFAPPAVISVEVVAADSAALTPPLGPPQFIPEQMFDVVAWGNGFDTAPALHVRAVDEKTSAFELTYTLAPPAEDNDNDLFFITRAMSNPNILGSRDVSIVDGGADIRFLQAVDPDVPLDFDRDNEYIVDFLVTDGDGEVAGETARIRVVAPPTSSLGSDANLFRPIDVPEAVREHARFILRGSKWIPNPDGSPIVITWSIVLPEDNDRPAGDYTREERSLEFYNEPGLIEDLRARWQLVFDNYEEYFNIRFVEIESNPNAALPIYHYALSTYPEASGSASRPPNPRIFMSFDAPVWYSTATHETGHVLALKHPFYFSGFYRSFPRVDSDDPSESFADNKWQSILSYTGPPSRLSADDLVAFYWLYGANKGLNAGDTHYRVRRAYSEDSVTASIQDTSGTNDWLDFSDLYVPRVDLNADYDDHFSRLSLISGSYSKYNYYEGISAYLGTGEDFFNLPRPHFLAVATVGIAYSPQSESLSGSRYSDEVFGNDLRNILIPQPLDSNFADNTSVRDIVRTGDGEDIIAFVRLEKPGYQVEITDFDIRYDKIGFEIDGGIDKFILNHLYYRISGDDLIFTTQGWGGDVSINLKFLVQGISDDNDIVNIDPVVSRIVAYTGRNRSENLIGSRYDDVVVGNDLNNILVPQPFDSNFGLRTNPRDVVRTGDGKDIIAFVRLEKPGYHVEITDFDIRYDKIAFQTDDLAGFLRDHLVKEVTSSGDVVLTTRDWGGNISINIGSVAGLSNAAFVTYEGSDQVENLIGSRYSDKVVGNDLSNILVPQPFDSNFADNTNTRDIVRTNAGEDIIAFVPLSKAGYRVEVVDFEIGIDRIGFQTDDLAGFLRDNLVKEVTDSGDVVLTTQAWGEDISIMLMGVNPSFRTLIAEGSLIDPDIARHFIAYDYFVDLPATTIDFV